MESSLKSPGGAAESVALSGLATPINSDPGLTPWAKVLTPLRGYTDRIGLLSRPDVPVVELFDGFQRIDLGKALVLADPDDARKAQGIATGMTAALLNAIKRDLENDRGFDEAEAAVILERVLFEKLGHL